MSEKGSIAESATMNESKYYPTSREQIATQPDFNYKAETERLYRERIGSAYDEYELADIEAAMMFETKDSDD